MKACHENSYNEFVKIRQKLKWDFFSFTKDIETRTRMNEIK